MFEDIYTDQRRYKENKWDSGKMDEGFKFGRPKFPDNYFQNKELFEEKWGDKQKKFLIEKVKKLQEKEAANPKRKFMRDYREAVGRELKLTPEEMKRLKIYSAVDTPLDEKYSIDMFMELESKDGKKSEIVTHDSTTFPGEQDLKSDVVIGEIPDPEEDAEGYSREMAKPAKIAAGLFEKRMGHA